MLQYHTTSLQDTANDSPVLITKNQHADHSMPHTSSEIKISPSRLEDTLRTTSDGHPGSETGEPIIDFDRLNHMSVARPYRLQETLGESAARLERLEQAVRTLLECIGEDPSREGLLATPERYAKSLLFLTKGYEQNVSDIVNGAIFQEHHNEMVLVKDIEIYSLCEHHLVPFFGTMHIAYIPVNSVIGLSKLARIAEMFSRRLQVQERLTKSVANAISEVLRPQGVAVVMESKHLCMAMRGVQKMRSTTVTSCMMGCFERGSTSRDEFLSLINMSR